jgi:hypothetical protein
MKKKELKELSASIIERLQQAIKKGDKKQALALVEEINRNKHDFDESYRVWIDLMMRHIAEKEGEEALYEIHRTNADLALWPRMDWVFSPLSLEDKVRRRAYTWTHWHMTHIDKIEEDEEKFTFTLKCDSGGSVNRWPEHGQTREGHPWSWGQKGVSYYCAHCPIVWEIMAIEKGGRPVWQCNPQPDGSCIQYLYKEWEKIPEKVYRRVGKKKDKKMARQGF